VKLKNVTAKAGAVALSTTLFAAIWGWIAAGGQSQPSDRSSDQTSAPVTAQPAVRRIVVVRRVNPDGTVTRMAVPESALPDLQDGASSTAPSRSAPVTRSRGS